MLWMSSYAAVADSVSHMAPYCSEDGSLYVEFPSAIGGGLQANSFPCADLCSNGPDHEHAMKEVASAIPCLAANLVKCRRSRFT